MEQRRVQGSAEARRILAELGDDVLDFEFRHGRMDDVFLALTGRTLRDADAATATTSTPTTTPEGANR